MGTGECEDRMHVRLASGSDTTFGVDDIAVAWAMTGGYWEREGVEVDWVPARDGVSAINAVITGQVDVGYGSWLTCLQRRREGRPVKIIASTAQSLAQTIVVNLTRISTAADIRGKRCAVDGAEDSSYTLATLLLRGVGIGGEEVQWIMAGPPPERIALLLSGEVDCALVRVEEAAWLSRQYAGQLATLFNSSDVQTFVPMQPHGVLCVAESFIRENPEICLALVRGLVRASRGMHDSFEHFQHVVRLHVTERPSEQGPRVEATDEELQMIWLQERELGGFAVNGGMTAVHWLRCLQVYADLRNEAHVAAMTFDEIAACSFVDDALAQLGVHTASHDAPDTSVRPGTASQPGISAGSGSPPTTPQRRTRPSLTLTGLEFVHLSAAASDMTADLISQATGDAIRGLSDPQQQCEAWAHE